MTDYLECMRSLGFLARCGVEIHMLSYDEFEIHGFYKSGSVTVNITEGKIYSRYDQVDDIVDYMPLEKILLLINKDWWERSKDRYAGWYEMSVTWKTVQTKLDGPN